MVVYCGNLNLAAKAGKIYAGVDNVARKVSKAYAGDANGKAQLIFSAETPLTISYTGTYTDEIVAMNDGVYRLLTLSGSGTLTFNQPVECDIWACGGGGGGGSGTVRYGGGGGGGGYVTNLPTQTIETIVVSIGAGGTSGDSGGSAGGSVKITGNITFSVDGGRAGGAATYYTGGNGGSGGGGGSGSSASTSTGGTGAGTSTRPFEDASLLPYCGGGGGGSYSTSRLGGAGGSNGADGAASEDNVQGTGGYYGGGDGGKATALGSPASSFGGGGGGGSKGYHGAAGYQGCVMVRWPVRGYVSFTYTHKFISDGVPAVITVNKCVAETGMSWKEWCDSEYNKVGLGYEGVGEAGEVGLKGVSVLWYNDYDAEEVFPEDIIEDGMMVYTRFSEG